MSSVQGSVASPPGAVRLYAVGIWATWQPYHRDHDCTAFLYKPDKIIKTTGDFTFRISLSLRPKTETEA